MAIKINNTEVIDNNRNVVNVGTVDGVDIAARNVTLTNTTNTANAALPKAGGTMTGDVSLGDNVSLNLGDADDASLVFDGTNTTLNSAGELILNGQTGITIDGNNITNQNTIVLSDMGAGNTGILLKRASGGNIKYGSSMDHSRPVAISGTNKSLGFSVAGSQGNASYAAFDFQIDPNAASRHPAVMAVRSPNNNALLFQGEQSDSTVVFSVDYDGNVVTSGTVDGVDIASRDGILTSTTTTANAALPKSGGTMTGNLSFGDNNKAIFGAGSDLQIYHDASNSYIKEVGTGKLSIQTNGAEIAIQGRTGTEFMARFEQDGWAKLYYDNAEKIATTSTGVSVTGNITVSGTVDGRNIDTDGTKLDTIETNADVTDTTNVLAALPTLTDNQLWYNIGGNMVAVDGTLATDAYLGSGNSAPTGGTATITGNMDISGNFIVGGTVDGVDIASRDGILTSTTTTANAAMPKAGGTFTGNTSYGDNISAKFGTGNDTTIYHNGSIGAPVTYAKTTNGSFYHELTGTGSTDRFAVQTSDGAGGSEDCLIAHGGSLRSVELYSEGVLSMETYNGGISVTGDVVVSGTVDGRDIATNIPSSLGTAGQVLTVNAGATAGEWADAASGGGGGITTGKAIAMAMVFG